MRREVQFLLSVLIFGSPWPSTAPAQPSHPTLPVPPGFSTNVDRLEPLQDYPLGVITKQAAFVRHGMPDRVVILPNGLVGWTYEVGERRQEHTYREPSGEEKSVYETHPSYGERSYTLEFDHEGVVIDVLYNENGRHDGMTALQLQRHKPSADKVVKDWKPPTGWPAVVPHH